MLYRHGDVMIARVAALPRDAQPRPGRTLAQGEVTGHSHRILEAEATHLWDLGGQLFLEVVEPSATLVHEEHRAINLPRGLYRVWQQREYTPSAARWVMD